MLRVLEQLRIDVRQELATCYLALAGGEGLEELAARKIDFTVLDDDSRGKEYVLVPIAAPEVLDELSTRGRAVPAEHGTAVFWTTAGPAAEALPPHLPRKPLSSSSILPYLQAPSPFPVTAPTVLVRDPLVASIADRLSVAELRHSVQSLQDFQTRYASTAACEAAGDFIHETFSSFGLDGVRFDPFTFSGGYVSRNVIAELRGRTDPDDILIVCGHYDSTSPAGNGQSVRT